MTAKKRCDCGKALFLSLQYAMITVPDTPKHTQSTKDTPTKDKTDKDTPATKEKAEVDLTDDVARVCTPLSTHLV
jgi:hypothetical protein